MKIFKNGSNEGFEVVFNGKTKKYTSIINLIGLIINALRDEEDFSVDVGKAVLITKGIKLIESGSGNTYKVQVIEGSKILKEFLSEDSRIDALRYFASILQKFDKKNILNGGEYQIKMSADFTDGQNNETPTGGGSTGGDNNGGSENPTLPIVPPTQAEVQQMIQSKTDDVVLNPEKESMIGNAKVVNVASYQVLKSDSFLVIGTPTENVSSALFLPNLNENQQIDLTLVVENTQGTTLSITNGSAFYEGENPTESSTKTLAKGTYRIVSLLHGTSTRHYVFDLKGAKGDKGTKGDKGEKGDVGDSFKIIRQNYTIQPGDKRIIAYHAENVLVITVPQNVQQAQFEVYNGSANPLSVVLEGQNDPLAVIPANQRRVADLDILNGRMEFIAI